MTNHFQIQVSRPQEDYTKSYPSLDEAYREAHLLIVDALKTLKAEGARKIMLATTNDSRSFLAQDRLTWEDSLDGQPGELLITLVDLSS